MSNVQPARFHLSKSQGAVCRTWGHGKKAASLATPNQRITSICQGAHLQVAIFRLAYILCLEDPLLGDIRHLLPRPGNAQSQRIHRSVRACELGILDVGQAFLNRKLQKIAHQQPLLVIFEMQADVHLLRLHVGKAPCVPKSIQNCGHLIHVKSGADKLLILHVDNSVEEGYIHVLSCARLFKEVDNLSQLRAGKVDLIRELLQSLEPALPMSCKLQQSSHDAVKGSLCHGFLPKTPFRAAVVQLKNVILDRYPLLTNDWSNQLFWAGAVGVPPRSGPLSRFASGCACVSSLEGVALKLAPHKPANPILTQAVVTFKKRAVSEMWNCHPSKCERK